MAKLYLATPMYGGNCTAGYASSVLNLSKIIPFQHMFITNESLVTRARNMLVHLFLKTDCTYLLFVDADIAFDHTSIQKMVDADRPVIGALYAKKVIDWNRVYWAAQNGVAPHDLPHVASPAYVQGDVSRTDSPVEVRSIGTGVMMIRRDVFDELKPDTRQSRIGSSVVGELDANTLVHHYFESGEDEETGEYLSEDYAFCQKWRKHGGKVYAAPWVQTLHIGTHHFG